MTQEKNYKEALSTASVGETISKEVYNVEVITTEETTDIPETHRGTVDNPFLSAATATVAELEQFILVNMFVAVKNASIQQVKLDQFVACVRRDIGSEVVDTLGVLSAIHNTLTNEEVNDKVLGWLKEVKSGQYTRLTAGILQLAANIGSGTIDLKTCNRTHLTSIKGIGYKTASMFLMYTRPNMSVACLDTHILKYLREEANVMNVPLSTPSVRAEYQRLEKEFIRIARTLNKSIPELDFEIWSKYRQKVDTSDSVTTQESTVLITEPVATASVESAF